MQSALSKRSNSVDLPPGGEACARASRRTPLVAPAMMLAATLCWTSSAPAQPIDDTFTYQGRLKLDGQPVNGPADLTFYLYDAATGGNVVGNPLTLPATAVTEGIFTVELNFDAPDFSGEARWLQVAARYPAGGPGSYTDLTPRQPLRSAPYAWHAVEAENGGVLTVDLGTPGVMWTRSPNGSDIFLSNALAGIGFSSPVARLHVRAPFGFPAETSRFEDTLGRSQLRLATPESAGRAELQAWNGQSNTAGPLIFNVGGGNVGIGNTTPVNRLDVEGGLAVGATFAGTSAAPTNGLIVEGRMGLGTATPHGNFQLQAVGGAGVWRGAIAATGTTNATVAGEWNGFATIGGHNAILNQWANLAINPHPTNGNVGIGTTTPTSRLDVVGTAEMDGLKLNGNGAAAGRVLTCDASGVGSWGPVALSQWTNTGPDIYYTGGDVGVGTNAPAAKLDVVGTARVQVLTITGGSDVAEPYDVAATADTQPRPGMVVAIDPDNVGKMRVVAKAYDKTVAGIISGANGIKPGITLSQTGTVADGEMPVASIGRVWCYCDADAAGPISAGDMLTTSNTPGHAMRVADHDQSQGAVLGKAMSSLKNGKGLVLVLVSLQ